VIIETGKTYIRKVRATSVGAAANVVQRDPLALQLRLSSALSLADLQPRGMPASAIICVRSIHAPRLPAQYTRSGGERPPLWWEERVRALLKQAVQQAARPLEGNVPLDADAVIFADSAELLACLASDWCAGNGGHHWWWQSLFRSGDIGQLLLPAWLETPEYIPAALHYLAARYKAVPFVQRLSSRDIHTLLQSITRSFALHQLQSVLVSPFQSERAAGPRWQETTEQPLKAASPLEEIGRTPPSAQLSYKTAWEHTPHRKHFSLPPEIPWRSWVPESMEPGLSLEQQALLGIGLMLIRASSITQTTSFARATYRWLNKINVEPVRTAEVEIGGGNPRGHAHPPFTSKGDVPQRERRQPQEAWLGNAPEYGNVSRDENYTASPSIQSGSTGDIERGGPGQLDQGVLANERERESLTVHSQVSETPSPHPPPEHPQEDTPEVDDSPIDGSIVSRYPGDRRGNTDVRDAQWQDHRTRRKYHEGGDGSEDGGKEVSAVQSEDRRLQGFSPPTPASGVPEEVEAGKGFQNTRVETEFGGIFYLSNLGLFLNLYGDFTTPLQPGLALSMWDFVALLGLQMVGESLLADPVWSLLASLSGRHEEESPGYAFEPPERWLVPDTWLRAFPVQDGGESWRWSVEDGRLRVLHPAQFLLLDVPLSTSEPLSQLRREMRSYSDLLGTISPQRSEEPLFPNEKLLPCGHAVINTFAGSIPPSLLRWLRWLMPYIYARLQRALGLEERQDSARVLCLHPASISVTATHVDIFFALKDLPIEIRIAGLDRNPGWVPAAGRFIAFHFQ
jgi:hypothetical protein